MESHSRLGTTALAHDPKIASADAKSPPNSSSATSENAAVRTTGQTMPCLLVAVSVLPSSGRPRIPESGHDTTAVTIPETFIARVSAIAITTPVSSSESTPSHSAARHTTTDPSTTASPALTIVRRENRYALARQTSTPPRSSTTNTIRPRLRSKARRPASAPMARDPNSATGCGSDTRSGQSPLNQGSAPTALGGGRYGAGTTARGGAAAPVGAAAARSWDAVG